MTIPCGLCWNIDSRKIIWLPRAHFGTKNESLKGLNVDLSINCMVISLSTDSDTNNESVKNGGLVIFLGD